MKRILFLVVALFAVATAWAHEGHEPAETDFKSDICAQCNMVVTSKSYAAQIVGSDKPLFFDDIGCLVQYERQGKVAPDAIHARYVRTVAGDAWVAVTEAVWVLTKDVRTPMGYGLHAFADTQGAEDFAKERAGAKVLTWTEAQAAIPEKMGMM